MLKMYHQNPHSGNTPDYWANSWDEIDFEEALTQCSTDPLLPLFEKYVKRDSLILEGGCGKGHWVAHFADRGHKIVGLDFAQRTLAELNTKRDGLWLTGGNVNSLPFADSTFDIYYSGGVVEHFEAGCEAALAEARRVIKPNGTLLLSVPYFSPLRHLLTPIRRTEWRKLSEPEADRKSYANELTYFQYAYTISEFKKILERAGLATVQTMGYSVIWGLYDLKALSKRAERKNKAAKKSPVTVDSLGPLIGSNSRTTVKDLLIGENTETVLNRNVTKLVRWFAANMMMFVCHKS